MAASEAAAGRTDHAEHGRDAEGKAVDPVCGMSVDRATARYRTEYGGHRYFFCGARCLCKNRRGRRYSSVRRRCVGWRVLNTASARSMNV